MRRFVAVIICASMISGCGTTSSIQPEAAVPHAVIAVNDSLTLTGRILLEDERSITVAVAGVSQSYDKLKLKSLNRVMLPDESLMLQEIVSNSSKAASNTGFLLGWMIIALATAFGVAALAVASN